MGRYAEYRRRKRDGAPLADPAQSIVGTDTPGAARRRRTPSGPTFRQAAEEFVREYEIITQGERNADHVRQKSGHIRVHLLPFFGERGVSEITAGLVSELNHLAVVCFC